MTNHSEAIGPIDPSDPASVPADLSGPAAIPDLPAIPADPAASPASPASPPHPARPADPSEPTGSADQVAPSDTAHPSARDGSAITPDSTLETGDELPSGDPFEEPLVTLRTPAELADALPYLLGFKPENSIVLMALHGERGRLGGRVRLGIPERTTDWPPVAEQLARCLVGGCERRGDRPDGIVAFLCQEPGEAESGQQVAERLRPLAQRVRTACGALDVPVFEVVCISDHRFWTYCCPDTRCCPPEGTPLIRPGTSVLAAAATYMGVQAAATQGEIRARLTPWETAAAIEQERALDAAGLALIPRMLNEENVAATETLDLARRIMARLAAAPPVSGTLEADNRDDELIAHDEAAALILGLQVRTTRDRAAEWMEGDEAPPALRLWRALSRRCVGAYDEHAAAPLSLAGWVAWSLGDIAEGQEALDMALRADCEYTFALLLHHACNEGMDPESIRRCLRRRQDVREDPDGSGSRASLDGSPEPTGTERLLEADTSAALEGTPRLRRRRLPRSPGSSGSRSSDVPRASAGPSGTGSSGGPAGTHVSGGPGTGPRNRRRTVRRGARHGR
ncbi:DUF4192 domain-containing protein [Streptomyces sp. WAC 01529]|uniref:DUF4192 domain-containing protein n=1 Tax=Streptomyces sp. WAC 01529 TaxID=2203205 RepID=UPI000F703579|nr:DUF4192 domain-containing protein [Streptomyces sp. WAC 01529]AZM55959.1 DUF4192 domain-containing protein [Streptomyces sp. WAC 01529]